MRGGRANDNLTLLEWEACVGFVVPMAKGVATIVDAKVEALCQKHYAHVQTYKAKIDHLESILASLKIHKPLELLPTTGGQAPCRA